MSDEIKNASTIDQPYAVRGVFDYIEANDGWSDSFRVVDDDSMPFALDDLRRFHGLEVEITIRRPPPAAPPFGFTQDDLGLLTTVADKIVLGLHGLQVERGDPTDDIEHEWAVDETAARLHRLADRIAALLPPGDELRESRSDSVAPEKDA